MRCSARAMTVVFVVGVCVVGAGGCAQGGKSFVQIDAGDDDRGDDDAGDIDASRHPPDDTPRTTPVVKLLLTEIVLAPSAGEFIEVMNPTTTDVSLADYYVTDSNGYFRLPTGVPAVDSGDFLARFPAAAIIRAKGVATIAISTAASFTTTYPGIDPTFSLGTGDAQMTLVNVNGTPTLTNTGEMVALFHWDGQSDLVEDCDIMIAGQAAGANTIVTKTGVQQDGPDADMVTTAYASEALTIAPQASSPASGKSTKRIALETGNQMATNGNGVDGGDETSEATAVTWDTTFDVPTPGQVPVALQ
jgi:hypothetical protein